MAFTDLICDNCGHVVEDEFVDDAKTYVCEKCGNLMRAHVGCGSFKLVFNQKTDMYDWNGNRNCYWDAVKKARSEGKNVKACNEN